MVCIQLSLGWRLKAETDMVYTQALFMSYDCHPEI